MIRKDSVVEEVFVYKEAETGRIEGEGDDGKRVGPFEGFGSVFISPNTTIIAPVSFGPPIGHGNPFFTRSSGP